MIVLENVRKTIKGTEVLRGISLTVKPGEIHAYLGHNGAGKTTTFRLVLGLLVPDSGRVEVLGVNPLKSPEVRAKIGYLPEYDLLYPNLSVRDNLRRYALLKGVYDERELRELLEFFELEEYAKKKVSALSSGTQRRVVMARAFLGSPEVLILDEPTRGLDPEWRLRFKRFLGEYARKNDASIVFSTHILSDVDEVCNTVTVIREGRVLFSGSLEEFRRSAPAEEAVLVKVADVERAIAVLREKGYSPEVVRGYIALKNAEPSEVNALLVKAGLRVEEIKRAEPSLEEVYAMLYEE
ncbi:multidrug ABC transporter ATP-binding protein [Thermococcus guaymasensis DSM 11113]|uniref:Multidrug ABC transporter ATP-binding protein n=1 Tax=Thermococcus guaymasensis DSM 11113 TaxID=1432656 RepID=A0A0X1KLG1_9EURY|nr:ABC transporter ATP-binding protein [Thermococcus guaymasensis]AJC72109.1 multidrug ABC transporter ATP-binding protein [Thermococcus guaymasensis DSM 11113]